jgi:hypothetical protein
VIDPAAVFPLPLSAYPPASDLIEALKTRIALQPINAVATGIFALAVVHTFGAARFAALANEAQHAHDARCDADGTPHTPSIKAEVLHFLGEVEVIFGLWAVVLLAAVAAGRGWETATHYFAETVNYTEALFVVVIMALASTRPVIVFAESALKRVAQAGGGTPVAWWVTILTIGPLLGSLITEPAAMTICALLLARQFYDIGPSDRLKYATLGLLFVNVSIGGTLTHFAAPPVLMVARPWNWTTSFMLSHFGWRAVIAIIGATSVYFVLFRDELRQLGTRTSPPDVDVPDELAAAGQRLLPVPPWVTAVHLAFMGWTVFTAHYPALFVGGFLIFLGFAKATAAYQSHVDLRSPMLVGVFLGGLVIHGGLQGWWIGPVLSALSTVPLFVASMVLTAINDNALITYLGTLVPNLDQGLKVALVEGAVTGGGLTVIANAPNPAGQAILGRFFGGSIMPLKLLMGSLIPTLIAALAFRLF